jgi:hypothetical protein
VAAIDDLIAQIEDKALRERLRIETDRINKEKKFGLVFEDHLPEFTPICSARVRKGSVVAQRRQPLSDLWRALSVTDDQAHCLNRSSGEKRQIPVDELVVVRQFGEPIFPALVPVDRVQNGPDDAPWHTLIEADNYHALQLLEYLYTGQVDCIYIDPPYNTGDKSWKYNNDYVDGNDCWRHSKWLSMMKKRLLLAKKLLNSRRGVLIVTIDEHEMHHLRVLLAQLFPQYYIQMVTAVTNPKGVTQGRFSRVEEYLIYCFGPDAYVADSDDNLLNPPNPTRRPRWKGLLRSGTNARRVDRKNMFYPVLIDEERNTVVGAGDSLPYERAPVLGEKIDGFATAWPIRTDGSFGNWGVGYVTFRKLIDQGYVACGKYDEKRKTYGLSYISEPNQKLIKTGGIVITGIDPVTNVVTLHRRDGLYDAFRALGGLVTYRVNAVRKQSALRRVIGLCRGLTHDRIDEDAQESVKARVVKKMAAEIQQLRDSGVFEDRAKQITGIDLKTIAVEHGTNVSKDDGEYTIEAASADIDRLFQEAGRLLGNGLHMDYWRAQGDRVADEVKVEVVLLAQDHDGMKGLVTFAEGEFDGLYTKHKRDIAMLKEQRRKHYERLRLATSDPQDIPWTLPDSIDFRRSVKAPEYDKHLYLEDDAKFRADLGSWEREVLAIELRDKNIVGWLRNVDRKSWSLEIPYRDAGSVKPMFPDLVVVRKDSKGFSFDILEPHDPSLKDNAAKAVGLAEFAEKHWALFARIQVIRKKKGADGVERYFRLDVGDDAVRKKVLAVTSNNQLDQVFEDEAKT